MDNEYQPRSGFSLLIALATGPGPRILDVGSTNQQILRSQPFKRQYDGWRRMIAGRDCDENTDGTAVPDSRHLAPAKTPHAGNGHRLDPELRISSGLSHMDVRRLPPLHAEEEEPIPTNSQQSGHLTSLPPLTA